jgi:outer membrane lipoprotein-sorting protein
MERESVSMKPSILCPSCLLLVTALFLPAQEPPGGGVRRPQEKPEPAPAKEDRAEGRTGKEEKKEEPASKAAVDPKVAAIEKAMAKMATGSTPVHFRFQIRRDDPYEDTPQQVEGEFWALGDQKLRLKMTIRLAGMKMEHEIVVNEEGTWLRMPGEGVIKYSPELMAKLKKLQEKGKGPTPSGSARSRLAILGGLRQQGFKLKWEEELTQGTTLVDVLLGEMDPKKKEDAPYDRCRLMIGRKDRIPRQVEFFKDGKPVEKVKYSDIEVGDKIDPQVFLFQAKPGERVVDVLDTWMREAILSALKSLEE